MGPGDDLDIGPPVRAVFTTVELHEAGRPLAVFVSDDGERFGLDAEGLRARRAVREANGHDTTEERRAQRALAGS